MISNYFGHRARHNQARTFPFEVYFVFELPVFDSACFIRTDSRFLKKKTYNLILVKKDVTQKKFQLFSF